MPGPWQTTLPIGAAIAIGCSAAAAAIVAAVITQIATAIIDKKRREHQNDLADEKWTREQSERDAQWRREDRFRWSQSRLEVYGRLAAACDSWLGVAKSIALHPMVLASNEEVSALISHQADVASAKGAAMIVGSTETRESADKFLRKATIFTLQAAGHLVGQDPLGVLAQLPALQDLQKDLIENIRKDLKIPDTEEH